MGKEVKTILTGMLALAAILSAAGCSSPPGPYKFSKQYRRVYFQRVERKEAPRFDLSLRQTEQGRDLWLLDKTGHCLISLPGKLLLWNTRVGCHDVSDENVSILQEYLWANDLDRVKIRVNQYAPWGELKRLWRNSDVNPFYRATFGTVSWIVYTVLPGRVFAGIPFLGDNYNPYTNAIYVYSDHPGMMVQLAARSKDLAEHRFKGTYATLGIIPGIDLYQEHVATRDTVRYFYAVRAKDQERASYKVLFPAYAMHLGPAAVAVGPIPALVYGGVAASGSVVGNVAGRMQADQRKDNQDPAWGSELHTKKDVVEETESAPRRR